LKLLEITSDKDLGIFPLGENLLGKIGGTLISLLEAQAGVSAQLLHGDGCVLCQRMPLPQVDIGAALYQRVKFQPVFGKELVQHRPVVLGAEENANVAAALGHIVDHVYGPGLPDGVLEPAGVELPHGVHKGFGHEGIVLGGYAEDPLFGLQILLLHEFILLVDLPGVVQEPAAVIGQRHAPVGPVEDGDADLLLQLLNGSGQCRLGHIKLLRRPVHGPGLGDGQAVADLL